MAGCKLLHDQAPFAEAQQAAGQDLGQLAAAVVGGERRRVVERQGGVP
jgi:hypothetical protein